jgi:TonB family protein
MAMRSISLHQWFADWSGWAWPWVANHLWQATLISVIAFLAVSFLLRNAPGRAKYTVWLFASAKFVLPSTLLLAAFNLVGIDLSDWLRAEPRAGEGTTLIAQLTAPIAYLDESVNQTTQVTSGHNELYCVITAVWLAGALLLIGFWLMRRYKYRALITDGLVPGDTRERQALDRVRSWLGITRTVNLSMVSGGVEPGVWGVLRPTVLLPESMADQLSEAELEAVMMHEMIHVCRWDNLVANLQRMLCFVFWFHPCVWLLDRLLLVERERACDEEVISLGGAADVYASSLLKVLRFCLGWNVPGASHATGSNLGRRLERIMSRNVQVTLSAGQRAIVGSIAALLVVLSMAVGLVSRDAVSAQSNKQTAGRPQGVPGGIPGGVPGGVPGGIPGGVPGGVSEYTLNQQSILERLNQAPEIAIEFKNSAKAPLTITEAKIRAVPRTIDEPGDEFAVLPLITVVNTSNRQVRAFSFEFRKGSERRGFFETNNSPIEPQATYVSGRQKRFFMLVGDPEGWSVRVGGVLFADGDVWGSVPPTPPPPPPPPPTPELMKRLEQAPETAVQFTNKEGTPLSINSATMREVRMDDRIGPNSIPEEVHLIVLTAEVSNNTDRRIVGAVLRFATGSSMNTSYASVRIEPHASAKVELPNSKGFSVFRGSTQGLEATVIGVRFEDGDVWGTSFPALPPPPPPLQEPPDGLPKLIRKSGGVFQSSATRRVDAVMPPLARAARISGSVVVEVMIDEVGNVISARALSGHPLLKDAAVDAARQWQFAPTLLSGVAVKVIGTLTFNFEP